ncbi:hypothetical protein Egran_00894 [Elaphomyces granulatus]|uniref:Uncharacterized protein n=1 Tax=Elaphomyces granulatus TaxID=519963 RepID=A0A232M4J7_9EURO|nr:hypothetical protein Egran_00894 [Elaphomyces granulatus]
MERVVGETTARQRCLVGRRLARSTDHHLNQLEEGYSRCKRNGGGLCARFFATATGGGKKIFPETCTNNHCDSRRHFWGVNISWPQRGGPVATGHFPATPAGKRKIDKNGIGSGVLNSALTVRWGSSFARLGFSRTRFDLFASKARATR